MSSLFETTYLYQKPWSNPWHNMWHLTVQWLVGVVSEVVVMLINLTWDTDTKIQFISWSCLSWWWLCGVGNNSYTLQWPGMVQCWKPWIARSHVLRQQSPQKQDTTLLHVNVYNVAWAWNELNYSHNLNQILILFLAWPT